jgi:hypothetical protein
MKIAYNQGYHFLILDPQAYISWTIDGQRFSSKLEGPLQFVRESVQPIKTFDNFNKEILKRFVFEHNEDLDKTLAFLDNDQQHFEQIRIYAIKDILDRLESH